MKNIFKIIRTFTNLPQLVRLEVLNYYLNRIFFRAPTNHQIIWTSFLYFASEPDTQVSLKDNGELYHLTFYLDGEYYQIRLRKGTSTDIFVFFQVFIAKDYHPLLGLLIEKFIIPKVIIDVGANVGYFSLLMVKNEKTDLLVAIEPEPSNHNLLVKNLSHIDSLANVHFLQAALWNERARLSIDSQIGCEWATQVREGISDRTCMALPLNVIMSDYSIDQIDVLKIDIEGAEAVLFNDSNFINCLSKIRVIAIEIHDHLVDRTLITSALKNAGFSIKDIGELTLGWKQA